MWEIKTEDYKFSLFQDTSFASDLQDSKSTSGDMLCIFGSRTVFFKSISWMCKKQSAVSHSSAESEILSLDAGFTRKWFARASVLGVRDADFELAPKLGATRG